MSKFFLVISETLLENKNEKTQYDAALAMAGVIRVAFRKKLCADLGLESLKFWPWFRKVACFYKI